MDWSHPMARLFWMMSGLVVWAAQFTIIYGVTSVACARGWYRFSLLGLDLVRASIAAATLLALGVTTFVLWQALAAGRASRDEPSEHFIETVTVWISGLSLLAIAYIGLPALLLPACSA